MKQINSECISTNRQPHKTWKQRGGNEYSIPVNNIKKQNYKALCLSLCIKPTKQHYHKQHAAQRHLTNKLTSQWIKNTYYKLFNQRTIV